MKIRILHTNDVHSSYKNFARVTTKIKELKNENTMIFDAGDFHDFKSIEVQGTDGEIGGKLLSIAGCEAMTIGNNEAFSGLSRLENMASKSKVPFLASNLYKIDGTRIKNINRSMIIERGGVRFLIIGTTVEHNEFLYLYNMKAVPAAAEIKKELENNKGLYDIAILLSHSGLREDRGYAKELNGLDVIIDGHSHVLMDEPEVINGTIIHQSGSFAEYLGVFDMEIENNKIISFKGKNISIKDEVEDKDIINEIALQCKVADERLSKPLYDIKEDVWHDVVDENPMTNLIADALKDLLECDLSIINSGIVNGGIRKGQVSNKRLLGICPSPLNPTYMEVKGQYIKEALEKTLDSSVCLLDGKGAGFRGRFLGRLHVSGAVIKHDGKHILSVLINGEELDEDKVYKVATSDYLQRGTGYPSLANNSNEYYRPEYIRDTLRNYLCKEDFVRRAFKDRWILVK